MLDDAGPVRAVRELQVEHLRVLLGLLEPVRGKPVLALRLDHRERPVAQIREQVVDALALAAADRAAGDDDPPGREADLLADLIVGPARAVERRKDVRAAGVCFSRQRASGIGLARGPGRAYRGGVPSRACRQLSLMR